MPRLPRRFVLTAALTPLLLAATQNANAQNAPSTKPPTVVVPTGSAATGPTTQSPANNASGNVAAQPPVVIPPAPSVNDPMLAPVPPPTQVVSSWQEALSLVRARSTDLQVAYDEVLRAEASSRSALAGTLPQLNGSAAYTHQILTTTSSTITQQGAIVQVTTPLPNTLSAGLSLSQPLFAPRVWHQMKTASIAEDGAKLSLEDEKRTIALAVANTVIGVVTNERIADLNRSGFRAALERLDLTRRKQILGAATGLDVVRAQQDVESARATLVTGDEQLRQAREALGLALGIPGAIGVNPTISLDSLVENAMGSCKQTSGLEQRADIAAQRVRADVASREVGDVNLQFLPTINAQSSLSETSVAAAVPNPTWNIQAVLSWNIWDGGLRYGALRNAHVDEDEANQNLTALRRNAQIQLVQAQRGVPVAEASRKVAADARALAAEVDRLTQVGYMSGQGTSLELVTAAAALRVAEIQLALQDFTLVKARVLALLQLANCPW
ncbi:MAG: TolC family protein [Polyangiaceae bacterium]